MFRDPVWDREELRLIYSPQIWRLVEPLRTDTPERQTNNRARRRQMVERILAEVGPRPGGAKSIADVGGRDGYYVAPFLDHGWSASVIDPVDAPVVDPRIVKSSVCLNAYSGMAAFDVLVLSHVLEHVVDLAGFLGHVRRMLRSGGLVYAEVPYEVRRVLIHADLGDPSHQIYFTTRALRHLFEASGFEIRHCAREWTTYDAAPIPAIVMVAVPSGKTVDRPRPPGVFHTFTEMARSL